MYMFGSFNAMYVHVVDIISSRLIIKVSHWVKSPVTADKTASL